MKQTYKRGTKKNTKAMIIIIVVVIVDFFVNVVLELCIVLNGGILHNDLRLVVF